MSLEQELARTAQALRRVTVQVSEGDASAGAGVLWDPQTVVTNAHVARGPAAHVRLEDGRALAARVVRRDPRRDLAALSIAAPPLPKAEIGDETRLRPGDLVMAVGSPSGVPGAVALGIVHSAPTAPVEGLGGRRPRWVRADIRLAPGNSGGPLADAAGRVVGLNTMVAGGLAYAVPSGAVRRFLADDRAPGTLGVALRPLGLGAGGAIGYLVLEVEPGGAAARAGLAPGDVLLGAGAVPFDRRGSLGALLADADAGDLLQLLVVRGGRRWSVDVRLRPPSNGRPRAA
ncbi:MAG TPA: trypsin-like peptidase domain-containing protein [Gemmatimonadales bacterium]|nr:trypsin-like peptidase domain-containing protein [Gemmatimonadales bacterium]